MCKVTLANSFHRLTRRGPSLTKLCLTAAVLLALALSPTSNPVDHGNADAFIKIIVTFCIGKRPNCGAGFGVCKVFLIGSCNNSVNAAISPLGGNRMEALFEAAPPNRDRLLEIAEDLVLEEAAARKLGFKSVAILKGSYNFDAAKGKFGGVIFNIKTTK